MSTFIRDGNKGTVTPVYLKTAGGPIVSIFPTFYTERNHCALLGSPSEGGLQMYDNKVRQPTTIQFSGIVKSVETDVFTHLRRVIRAIALNDILCEFQTKSGIVKNMIIESIEEIGSNQRYDAMEIKVSLVEYLEHNAS